MDDHQGYKEKMMLYSTTNQKPWSQTVKIWRPSFFGQIPRLPDDASAKLALNEFRNSRAKKFRKGQTLTWLKKIERDVRFLEIDLEQAIEQTQNREQWRGQIERLINMS